MDEDPQAADNQVEQVVQELHVCDHGSVAACEGSTVADKAHQKDDFIAQLKTNKWHGDDMSWQCTEKGRLTAKLVFLWSIFQTIIKALSDILVCSTNISFPVQPVWQHVHLPSYLHEWLMLCYTTGGLALCTCKSCIRMLPMVLACDISIQPSGQQSV